MSKHIFLCIVVLLLAGVLTACGGRTRPSPTNTPPASPETVSILEQLALQMFMRWAAGNGVPYRNVNVTERANDGFFAQMEVKAEFRLSAAAPWEEREAQIECRKVGERWQCDDWFNFSLTQAEMSRRLEATVAAATAAPTTTAIAAAAAQSTAIALGHKDPETGVLIATNPTDGAEYVYVPAGSFIMGSSDNDSLASDNEKPQQTDLYLDAFWIMQTEVTNAQYAKCVTALACGEPDNTRWKDPAYAEHPVTSVNWVKANDYAKWVGGRLPTEAEWEKACRGTDGRTYPWGDDPPTVDLANFGRNVNDTTPVGSYPKGISSYGALDMAGNVYEWASSGTYGAIERVRGGSWGSLGDNMRCAFRGPGQPDRESDYYGVRVVSAGFVK